MGSGEGAYQCFKTTDGWVFVGVQGDKDWQSFCDAFGVSGENREEFVTREKRGGNPAKMEKIVADVVSRFSTSEVAQKLTDAGVPGAPVNTVDKLLDDPHLKFTKNFVPLISDPEVTLTPDKKITPCAMLPIRSDDYNPDVTEKWTPPPKLGEHSVEVLLELGYTEEQITDLRKRKVIFPYA